MADDGDDPRSAFFFPEEGISEEIDPRAISRQLVASLPRYDVLRMGEATILFVFRADPLLKAGKRILGTMALPQFQGSHGPFCRWMLAMLCGGTIPDFIMTLDSEFWTQATPLQRRALVDHELKHAGQQTDREGEPRFTEAGDPVWGIVAHDLEEFDDIVREYGAWKGDIARFVRAAREGGVE